MFTERSVRFWCLACLAGLLMSAVACTTPPPAAPPTQSPTPAPAAPPTAPAATPAGQPSLPSGEGTPSLEGNWEGSIQVASQDIGMVIRFTGSGSEAKGMMDIPAQSAKDIPLSKVDLSASKVSFRGLFRPEPGHLRRTGSGRWFYRGPLHAGRIHRRLHAEARGRQGGAHGGPGTLPAGGGHRQERRRQPGRHPDPAACRRAIPGGRADQRQRRAEPRRGGLWLPAIPPDRRSLHPQRDRRAAHG